MPSDKHPHGTTLHQAIVLAIVAKYGPLTSSEIAEYYVKLSKVDVAYNYQYIITRRMADRGLIKAKSSKNDRSQKVFHWSITPEGKKLLNESRKLAGKLNSIK